MSHGLLCEDCGIKAGLRNLNQVHKARCCWTGCVCVLLDRVWELYRFKDEMEIGAGHVAGMHVKLASWYVENR